MTQIRAVPPSIFILPINAALPWQCRTIIQMPLLTPETMRIGNGLLLQSPSSRTPLNISRLSTYTLKRPISYFFLTRLSSPLLILVKLPLFSLLKKKVWEVYPKSNQTPFFSHHHIGLVNPLLYMPLMLELLQPSLSSSQIAVQSIPVSNPILTNPKISLSCVVL